MQGRYWAGHHLASRAIAGGVIFREMTEDTFGRGRKEEKRRIQVWLPALHGQAPAPTPDP